MNNTASGSCAVVSGGYSLGYRIRLAVRYPVWLAFVAGVTFGALLGFLS